MKREMTPETLELVKGVRSLSEDDFHALIAAHSGYSQETVKRVVQAYWMQVCNSFEDGQLVTIIGTRVRMALVLRVPRMVKAHLANPYRLAAIFDTPKYLANMYRIKVRNSKYGQWVNMLKTGHQFLEL
jgi:hypothetical protein